MKISLNKLDAEDLEVHNFVKFKSKRHKLTGKQSVTQLVSRAENSGPNLKFANPDLNALSKMGFLDELISGIKTGKEASVFLGRNAEGFVAVKMYTDLRVRSFRRDASYEKAGSSAMPGSKRRSDKGVRQVSMPDCPIHVASLVTSGWNRFHIDHLEKMVGRWSDSP